MAILSIEDIQFDDKTCYVQAIIEDVVLTRTQTLIDPPEFGPGLCSTSFNTEDVEIPVNEKEFMKLLEELCPAWRVVDKVDVNDFDDPLL